MTARVEPPPGTPRPVPDALFEWPRAGADPAADASVLVVGEDAAAVVTRLHKLGLAATGAHELVEADLRAAAVVALLGEPGTPLHPDAMIVAGAGRILVAPRAEPTFGLTPGGDHLAYETQDRCVAACDAALVHLTAFAPMTALARLAAEPYRASVIAARGVAAPRATSA